jgi:uncharacterized protein (TIGR00162 family)
LETDKIRIKKNLKIPNNPTALIGMPGIGNVGKLVAENLRLELKAERIGAIYSPSFPPQAVMLKNGRLRLVCNTIYLVRRKEGDIIIITGDTQAVTPDGQYSVNSLILRFLKSMNCKMILTVGGYNMGGNTILVKSPRVFGNATNNSTIKSFKGTKVLFGKSKGLIWGSAGLIPAFARLEGIDGICIMGETSALEIDAGAAKAVITEISKVLKLDVSTNNLDKIIKQTSKLINSLEQHEMGGMMPQQQLQIEGKDQRPSYIR